MHDQRPPAKKGRISPRSRPFYFRHRQLLILATPKLNATEYTRQTDTADAPLELRKLLLECGVRGRELVGLDLCARAQWLRPSEAPTRILPLRPVRPSRPLRPTAVQPDGTAAHV